MLGVIEDSIALINEFLEIVALILVPVNAQLGDLGDRHIENGRALPLSESPALNHLFRCLRLGVGSSDDLDDLFCNGDRLEEAKHDL